MKTEDQKFKNKDTRKAVKNFRIIQKFYDSDNKNKNMENKDKKRMIVTIVIVFFVMKNI